MNLGTGLDRITREFKTRFIVGGTDARGLISHTRASVATYVDANGEIAEAAVDTLRTEHTGTGTVRGLLLESAATNRMLRSEDLSNSWINVQTTEALNQVAAPFDGSPVVADELIEDTATNRHMIYQAVSAYSAGDNVTISAIIKRASGSRHWGLSVAALSGAHSIEGFFDGSDGSKAFSKVRGDGVVHDYGSIALGGGWYWCWLAGTCGATRDPNFMAVFLSDRTADAGSYVSNQPSYTGDGSSSIYVVGAQVIAGLGPTSYIETTTAAVARSADAATIPTSSFGFSAVAGTLALTLTPLQTPEAEVIFASFNDGTANETIEVYADASANIRFRVVDGGVTQADIDSGVNAAAQTEVKIAVAWSANDFAISVDGNAVVTDTGGTLPTVTTLDMAENAIVSRMDYWPTRQADATLVTEST